MLDTINDFVEKIWDFVLDTKFAIYYLVGFIGLFALIYFIAFIVSFCGRLSKVRKAEKLLLESFTPEQMDEALEKMPNELRYAYISARDRRVNPLSVFTFESCVRTPFSLSFASRFVKFTVVFAFLMSLVSYSFFGLAAMRTNETIFADYSWYALLSISVIALFGTAIAAIISSSRHKNAVKRYERFAEAVALAEVSQFISTGSNPALERSIPKGNVDEFVEGVNIMCKEGASLASLKEAAYQLQQMRGRSENLNPVTQHKLNETVNLIVKAMASTIRNEQAAG